jgi:hypothetical protein
MANTCNEPIDQIFDLSFRMLGLVKQALLSESYQDAGIVDYSLICECASRIQSAAEERRQELARAQWEKEFEKRCKTEPIAHMNCSFKEQTRDRHGQPRPVGNQQNHSEVHRQVREKRFGDF